MKSWVKKTEVTTSSMPISGWLLSRKAIIAQQPPAISQPAQRETGPGPRTSASSQAATMAKQGLRNSEGCSDRPGIGSQRRPPLISTPTTRVAAVSRRPTPKPRMASRRTCRGESRETVIIRAMERAR